MTFSKATQGGETYEEINHPPHYNKGGIEAIDVIEAWDLNFNTGTVVKYIARHGRKPGETAIKDLQKGLWYLQREIERLQKERP